MANSQSVIRSPHTTNPQSAIRNPHSIARSAGIVSIAVMGSRILGLVREQVFATFFGAGYAMDAFIIAFRVPNLLRDLFAEGALSAAFVTTFSQTIAKRGEIAAWRLANLVNNGLILILSLIVLAGIAFAPGVVGFLTDVNTPHVTYDLAVRMTRIMLPFLIMVSLSAVAMGVLNTKDRFGIPASASTMFNVGSIIGGLSFAYFMAPDYIRAILHGRHGEAEGVSRAIIGMAIGTLIGGILQWLIQVPSLRTVGYRWQPVLSFRDEGVRQVMRLMAPAIIGSAALQVNVFVNTRFASSLGEGPVSWLQYAFRLIYLPVGIFGVAISTATLPVASRAAALENLDEFRRTIASSLRLMFLLTIPSAVGLMVLSRPIVSLIYQHGRFSSFDADQVAVALLCNAIGLTAYSGVRVLAPAFYALNDARIPMIASLLSILINYGVATLTVGYLGIGHRGLALSISAVAIINFSFLFIVMRRRLGGIEGRSLALVFGKITAASCLMGAVCWLVSRQLQLHLGTARLIDRLIVVGSSIAIGIALLYPAARLLKLNEVDQLTEALKRKLRKR
ncbi:MAG: murein biosynthesis integral membrane protein MurJ [Blastocatellia bacterium]|nr:murein biosynthesis integral membrane protein MurJ [Blastocatellia bacterium]